METTETCEHEEALAYTTSTGRVTRCRECGGWVEMVDRVEEPERPAMVPAAPRDPVLHHRVTLPGPAPDRRVQVATDDALRPSSTAPVERITRTEDDFTVRLRRLVVEMRAAELDGASAPAIVYRERVQTSGSSYDGPRIGSATVRRPVTDRLHALADVNPKAARTLVWLRAFGPAYELLTQGRASLVLAQCARALGDVHQQLAWVKAPAGAEVWARAALGRAMDAWWGA